MLYKGLHSFTCQQTQTIPVYSQPQSIIAHCLVLSVYPWRDGQAELHNKTNTRTDANMQLTIDTFATFPEKNFFPVLT